MSLPRCSSVKGSWIWGTPGWAVLLRVVQGDKMRKEAPWRGVALRLWGHGEEAGCPFPGHCSPAIGTMHLLFHTFLSTFLSFPHSSSLCLPFLFYLSPLFPLSLPSIPALHRYPMFSRYTQPRGNSTNICFHLHSLLACVLYILDHNYSNCFTILVC